MRAAVAVVGATTVAAAAGQLRQSSTACSYVFNGMGTSYDLTSTHHSSAQGTYIVKDVRDTNAQYYFNPCDQVGMPSTSCQARNPNMSVATGWQLESPGGAGETCYRLGGAAASGWNFSFFDVNYPNRGIVMSFYGGESTWCPGYPGPNAQTRSLSLELTCDPSINPGSATYADGVSVREENTCDYRVQIPSLAGCPLECVTGSNLCNGHGVCGFNSDAQRSQCYCYGGWAGGRCDTGEHGVVLRATLGVSLPAAFRLCSLPFPSFAASLTVPSLPCLALPCHVLPCPRALQPPRPPGCPWRACS